MSCPSIWATLSALLINILLLLPVVLHSDQPSEGESRSAVSASRGRLHYPRRRRWWLHALTDRLALMCNRRRPAVTLITQSIIFSFSISCSFVYFASSVKQHHADASACVSNCRVRQLQFSGIFVALGFVGNGVITVMINSP